MHPGHGETAGGASASAALIGRAVALGQPSHDAVARADAHAGIGQVQLEATDILPCGRLRETELARVHVLDHPSHQRHGNHQTPTKSERSDLLRPFTPMSWMHVHLGFGFGVYPTISNPEARKYESMNAILIDNSQMHLPVGRQRID
jgi:hypothetical protein